MMGIEFLTFRYRLSIFQHKTFESQNGYFQKCSPFPLNNKFYILIQHNYMFKLDVYE